MDLSLISLKDIDDRVVDLKSYSDKPALLIIESLASIAQNTLFKSVIQEQAKRVKDLDKKMRLIAVADLSGTTGAMLHVAHAAISQAQAREPLIRILVDREGLVNSHLRSAPDKSNVIVLDVGLRPVLGFSGTLSREKTDAVLRKLSILIGVDV